MLDFLAFEDGIDMLSRNVSKGLPLDVALYTREAQFLSASRGSLKSQEVIQLSSMSFYWFLHEQRSPKDIFRLFLNPTEINELYWITVLTSFYLRAPKQPKGFLCSPVRMTMTMMMIFSPLPF
jgi:hypothetical protein